MSLRKFCSDPAWIAYIALTLFINGAALTEIYLSGFSYWIAMFLSILDSILFIFFWNEFKLKYPDKE